MSENATITMTADSYVDSFLPTTNFDGNSIFCGVRDISLNTHIYRAILFANIASAIPRGSTILTAFMRVHCQAVFTGAGSFTLRIQKVEDPSNWVEQNVTQEQRNSLVDWGTAGIDVSAPPPAEVSAPWITAIGDFDLTGLGEITQDALDNESGNFAVRLKRNVEGVAQRAFDLTDHTNGVAAARPRLIVTYDLPVPMDKMRPFLGHAQLGHRPAHRRPGRGRMSSLAVIAA